MDLAESGHEVYLVEAGPDIGGKVATFDCLLCKVCHRYFPDKNDYEKMICGVCYVPELLDEVKKNKNIKIFNHSTIHSVEKQDSIFQVTLKKSVDDEPDSCVFESNDSRSTLEVGSIILSPGFSEFDPSSLDFYGYGDFENVVTSFEFEAMIKSSGGNKNYLKRPSDGKVPKKIGFIQCVGSRERKNANPYCSSICCMFALKEAVMAQEAIPDLETSIFFMDMRAFGKQFENYYQEAKNHNIQLIRNNRISDITEDPDTRNLRLNYIYGDELKEGEFDLVVLTVGMEPPKGSKELSDMLNIDLNEYGFCSTELLFSPSRTNEEGIFVSGGFSGPKDLPDSVAQASSAASCASAHLRSIEQDSCEMKAEFPAERDISGMEPKIGVFLGTWGENVDLINTAALVEFVKTIPDVVYVEDNNYGSCPEYQKNLQSKIKEQELNRIVAAGRPLVLEPILRNSMQKAGLNPYLIEFANIREQCFFVHEKEPALALEKAKDLINMAVAKVRLLEPLEPISVPAIGSGLVIGGGLSGMTAAIGLARQGFTAYLVEKEPELGGLMRRIHYELGLGINESAKDVKERLEELKAEIASNDKIHVFTNSHIKDIKGYVGNFNTIFDHNGVDEEINHGVVIIATGGQEYKPEEYLYGKDDRVMTQLELEEKLARDGGVDARTVAMIHCVGCRNDERPYCSRVCCLESIKNALRIKDIEPDTEIYMLFRDMRTYGFSEIYYEEAARRGIKFVRYYKDKPPVVTIDNGLEIAITDRFLDEELLITPDLIALGAATLPYKENEKLGQMLNLPLTKNDFFLEKHMKFNPVEFNTRGVFLCGLAHSPKFFEECISEAEAAVSRASTFLWSGEIELEPTRSEIVDANCDGCAYCVDPCPYQAITLIEYMKEGQIKKSVDVNKAHCRGCGICQATCPKKGVVINGFKLDQLTAMVDAVLGLN
jgi:heterodisulfide reductase subunit A